MLSVVAQQDGAAEVTGVQDLWNMRFIIIAAGVAKVIPASDGQMSHVITISSLEHQL